ncbi:HAD family hydrolase [Paeniglutamicibacter antarcticus]|uniref:HAD family hydrolase n=1 Tax=Paeniglutamicibacter antarcticus TaxID=494023 RepID=A0ABP9TLD2_9MICC
MENTKDALGPTHGISTATRIEGVLFDIDDTLVDLNSAAIQGFHQLTGGDFGEIPASRREEVARDYANDGAGAYERYMTGELTFLGQRVERIRRAYGLAGVQAPPAEAMGDWSTRYEDVVQSLWAPFPDVHECLDALDELSIPYGAVSNNVESYQRNKLKLSGLHRIDVLVGSDTVGAPKPDPRPFHEGCRLLGSSHGATLYVGDNPVNDVQGAANAGLQGLLLDRAADHKTQSAGILSNLGTFATEMRMNSGMWGR